MVNARYLSSAMLAEVLTRAEQEEREALTKVLRDHQAKPMEPIDLQEQICRAAGHSVGNFVRGGEGVSYSELLLDASKQLQVEELTSRYSPMYRGLCLEELDWVSSDKAKYVDPETRLTFVNIYVDELERKIVAKVMVVAYESATLEQRAVVDAKLAEFARLPEGNSLSGLSTSAALLLVGNLGGFATYTLMSTVLSSLSLGMLGFPAYTLASSLLSVVLGPAGWLSLAAYGVFKLGSPDAGKTVRLAATCAMTSQRLREQLRRQE